MAGAFSLLDRYIINQLVPPLAFSIAICTILGELIGITFEQIEFVADNEVSIGLSAAVHLLKLPTYLSVGLPFALLLATLTTCSDLSRKGEVTALRASGISWLRITLPILLLGIVCSAIAFVFHEALVPPANYKVATMLEEAWGVDRTELAKYNHKDIVYLQYDRQYDEQHKGSSSGGALSYAFLARRFHQQQMKNVTFVQYRDQSISEIIVSEAAQWNEDAQVWEFLFGQKLTIGVDGSYENMQLFKTLPRQLTHDILEYAGHTRDYREMNVFELRDRLSIIQNAVDAQALRQLQISIQERYANPFSALVFSYLGACVGFKTDKAGRSNSFGIAVLIIFGFYVIQYIANYLSAAAAVPVIVGVWMPNAIGFSLGAYVIRPK